MNLPNKLTLTRIILVPVFMIFVSLTGLDGIVDGTFNAAFYLLAGIVFAAASFTDFLDGHLARKWHMVTDFGKFADPLADKLLTTVAFIYMLRDGVCSPVVLCIILAREFAVSGLRMVAAGAKDGKVIVEKINMVSRHTKPRKQGETGGIVQREAAMYASKVQVVCPKCNKGTRIAHKIENGKKTRVCKHCGAEL